MKARGSATIDTEAMKSGVDLLGLVGRDAHLRKIASTRGGEYAGACPRCGGDDRLRVQPDRGLWMCRQCHERWSDAIEYIRWLHNVTFLEAVKMLGGDLPLRGGPVRRVASKPIVLPTPSSTWRTRSDELLEEAAGTLWSRHGCQAREYLHSRGLTAQTLFTFHIGYLPTDRWDRLERWGFEEGAGRAVWLPRGIVIPWRFRGETWCLKIRRPSGDPKYWAVRGSVPMLFGEPQIRSCETIVLPEGELDAMLLWQQVNDLVDVASLGAAGKGLDDHRATVHLLGASRWLVAYDGDDAGAKGAAKLLASSSRARRLALPEGQDITDHYLAGGDLRRLVTDAVRPV